MASKTSLEDQQKQVQDNIHSQIKTFCNALDGLLLSDSKNMNKLPESCSQTKATPRRSGLSFAVGRDGPPSDNSGEFICNPIYLLSRNLFEDRVIRVYIHSMDNCTRHVLRYTPKGKKRKKIYIYIYIYIFFFFPFFPFGCIS